MKMFEILWELLICEIEKTIIHTTQEWSNKYYWNRVVTGFQFLKTKEQRKETKRNFCTACQVENSKCIYRVINVITTKSPTAPPLQPALIIGVDPVSATGLLVIQRCGFGRKPGASGFRNDGFWSLEVTTGMNSLLLYSPVLKLSWGAETESLYELRTRLNGISCLGQKPQARALLATMFPVRLGCSLPFPPSPSAPTNILLQPHKLEFMGIQMCTDWLNMACKYDEKKDYAIFSLPSC